MKKLFAVILLVCLGMTNVAFASGEINYSLNPNILSGTFEQEWSKGTVGKFHNHNVYVGMKVMLRLDKKSSANCTVGVGVRKFSGSTSTIVGYATMSFNKSNSSTSYKFYPSYSTTYTIYGDNSFAPNAGTYAYVAKSNGPSNLAGRYAAFMTDRLG